MSPQGHTEPSAFMTSSLGAAFWILNPSERPWPRGASWGHASRKPGLPSEWKRSADSAPLRPQASAQDGWGHWGEDSDYPIRHPQVGGWMGAQGVDRIGSKEGQDCLLVPCPAEDVGVGAKWTDPQVVLLPGLWSGGGVLLHSPLPFCPGHQLFFIQHSSVASSWRPDCSAEDSLSPPGCIFRISTLCLCPFG